MTTDMQSAAVEYALQGKKVLPCKQDKAPYTSNGFKDATSQVDQVTEWWKHWPNALDWIPLSG
jgi:hypothetical protein